MKSKFILLATTAFWLPCSVIAGDVSNIPMPKMAISNDERSLDLLTGFARFNMKQISIGGDDNLLQRTYQFNYDDYRDNFKGQVEPWAAGAFVFSGGEEMVSMDVPKTPGISCTNKTVNGADILDFCTNSGLYVKYNIKNSDVDFAYPQNDLSAYFMLTKFISGDGTNYIYDTRYSVNYVPGTSFMNKDGGHMTRIVRPNGEIINIYYKAGVDNKHQPRIRSVVSNYGYMLKYEYWDAAASNQTYAALMLKKITVVNLSVEYCDPNADSCTFTHQWPSWTYNTSYGQFDTGLDQVKVVSETVTDSLGNSYILSNELFQFPSGRQEVVSYPQSSIWQESSGGGGSAGVNEPYELSPAEEECISQLVEGGFNSKDSSQICIIDNSSGDYEGEPPESNGVCADVGFDGRRCIDGPFTIQLAGQTWRYNFSTNQGKGGGTMLVEGPTGNSKTIVSGGVGNFLGRGIISIKDELNRTTTFEYETNYSKISKVTYPEGNYAQYTYDIRGNLTESRFVGKPGSGVADVVWTAHYPTTCASTITCNKPDYTIDPKSQRTDFTYDSSTGLVLTKTDPADSSGIRPQVRYTYTPLYAQVKNATGQVTNAEGPIYKLTKTSTCRSATSANPASCMGTANETVTEYTYGTSNLLLTKMTVRAGNANVSQAASATNVWQTTTYAYDDIGNRTSVDGPLPGTVDQMFTTYDVLRRPVYEIGADPDGSGSLPSVAVHHLYDADGREYRTEEGTGVAASLVNCSPTLTTCAAFTVTSYTQRTYDPTTGLEVKSITATP